MATAVDNTTTIIKAGTTTTTTREGAMVDEDEVGGNNRAEPNRVKRIMTTCKASTWDKVESLPITSPTMEDRDSSPRKIETIMAGAIQTHTNASTICYTVIPVASM